MSRKGLENKEEKKEENQIIFKKKKKRRNNHHPFLPSFSLEIVLVDFLPTISFCFHSITLTNWKIFNGCHCQVSQQYSFRKKRAEFHRESNQKSREIGGTQIAFISSKAQKKLRKSHIQFTI